VRNLAGGGVLPMEEEAKKMCVSVCWGGGLCREGRR
jgi:hypothetical protein